MAQWTDELEAKLFALTGKWDDDGEEPSKASLRKLSALIPPSVRSLRAPSTERLIEMARYSAERRAHAAGLPNRDFAGHVPPWSSVLDVLIREIGRRPGEEADAAINWALDLDDAQAPSAAADAALRRSGLPDPYELSDLIPFSQRASMPEVIQQMCALIKLGLQIESNGLTGLYCNGYGHLWELARDGLLAIGAPDSSRALDDAAELLDPGRTLSAAALHLRMEDGIDGELGDRLDEIGNRIIQRPRIEALMARWLPEHRDVVLEVYNAMREST